MLPVILVAGFVLGIKTPAYQEFVRHSNGNPSYEISYVSNCPTGVRSSGYALAPAQFVLFKQKNYSGEAGPTCVTQAEN